MPNPKLHIQKGTTVNAAWTDVKIAYSVDGGNNWTTIKRDQVVSVGSVRTKNSKTGSGSGGSYTHRDAIVVNLADRTKFSFDVKDVANQPTWNPGGVAGLQAAVTAMNGW
jgi:hypothetical protein